MLDASIDGTTGHDSLGGNELILDIWWQVNQALRAEVEGPKSVDSLTTSQFRIIRGLAEGPLMMTSIARIAGVTRGTATRMVDGLVSGGLARRFSDPANRRVVRVRLTAKGRKLREKTHERAVRYVETLFGHLDQDEKADLERLLTKVARALEQPPKDQG